MSSEKMRPLLTTKEAARYYNKSVAWFERARWLGDGHGPRYSKIGRSVRYHADDLIAFFEKSRGG